MNNKKLKEKQEVVYVDVDTQEDDVFDYLTDEEHQRIREVNPLRDVSEEEVVNRLF